VNGCAQTAKKAAPEKQEAAKNRPRTGRGSQLSAELVAHHAEQLEQTLRDARAFPGVPERLARERLARASQK
jgi:hypothetical protein